MLRQKKLICDDQMGIIREMERSMPHVHVIDDTFSEEELVNVNEEHARLAEEGAVGAPAFASWTAQEHRRFIQLFALYGVTEDWEPFAAAQGGGRSARDCRLHAEAFERARLDEFQRVAGGIDLTEASFSKTVTLEDPLESAGDAGVWTRAELLLLQKGIRECPEGAYASPFERYLAIAEPLANKTAKDVGIRIQSMMEEAWVVGQAGGAPGLVVKVGAPHDVGLLTPHPVKEEGAAESRPPTSARRSLSSTHSESGRGTKTKKVATADDITSARSFSVADATDILAENDELIEEIRNHIQSGHPSHAIRAVATFQANTALLCSKANMLPGMGNMTGLTVQLSSIFHHHNTLGKP